MSAVLKLFRSAEKKKKENVQAPGLEIGMPTQVSHNFSGKVNPDGTIGGIPDSWKQRLKLMITTEEALNPQNAEKATQILKWIETRDDHTEEFMRVNSDSPPSSIVSSSGTNSGASFVSYIGEVQELNEESSEDINNASSSVEPPVPPGLDNSVVNEPSKAVCDNEPPTLRRKKKDNHTTRQGPRVTRNLSEDQILSELQDCCTMESPWINYRKVSALFIILSQLDDPPDWQYFYLQSSGRRPWRGGGGSGHSRHPQGDGGEGEQLTRKYLILSSQVAIKDIDLNKQTKKDLILMEIKVMKELHHPNLVNFKEVEKPFLL